MDQLGAPYIGLYQKFNVSRTDGRDQPGEKHDGCAYFVLDLTHDPHATAALEAYVASCREDPACLQLGTDLYGATVSMACGGEPFDMAISRASGKVVRGKLPTLAEVERKAARIGQQMRDAGAEET